MGFGLYENKDVFGFGSKPTCLGFEWFEPLSV